jgi:hypothetical protein
MVLFYLYGTIRGIVRWQLVVALLRRLQRHCRGSRTVEAFPTECTNPLRAKSLFAAASLKSDLWITYRISLKTSFIRLSSNVLESP